MALGNPSAATTDPAARTNFLLPRSQYSLSYNDDTHQANWVSWSYHTADTGGSGRTDAWAVETDLPPNYLRIGTATFGGDWNRGHMCPSGDRTVTDQDNEFTFRMSNMIPQAARNNQGLWQNFEAYCRGMADDGSEILITSGPSNFSGSTLANGMKIPGAVWKIAVKIPSGPESAALRTTTGCRVIAIVTPNTSSGLGTWQSYITSVEEIEANTGLRFFGNVDPAVATYLKNVVDTGTSSNQPTVITSFSPTSAGIGATVTISGYHFGTNPVVRFNGITAETTVTSDSLIQAVVPSGAETGAITVTGSSGTDSSNNPFEVVDGTLPVLALSTPILGGFGAGQGGNGPAQAYVLTGANLSGPVTINAPPHFKISIDGNSFADSVILNPQGGITHTKIFARIDPTAATGSLTGVITHSGGGATQRLLSVSGIVIPAAPTLELSKPSLAGFTSLEQIAGPPKNYTLTGHHLGGPITVSASAGFEISADGVSFAQSLSLTPASGNLSNIPLQIRLKSPQAAGLISGAITHSGGGAATATLAVSGSVSSPGTQVVALASWEVGGLANFGPSPHPAAGSPPVISTVGLTRGSGMTSSGGGAAAAWGGNGLDGNPTAADAIAHNDFITFSFSSGAWMAFDRIAAYNIRRSPTGPTSGQWQYQTGNNDFENIGTPITWGGETGSSGNLQPEIPLSAVAGLRQVAPGVTVTFRLVPYGATSSAGTFYFNNLAGDDLVVMGSVSGPSSPPPAFAGPLAAQGISFTPLSYQLTASRNPLSFSIAGLPEGLSLDQASGLISGTPIFPGIYPAVVTATNADGDGTTNLLIVIAPNPGAPQLAATPDANALIGTAFDYQLSASGGRVTYLASNLPAGLSLDSGSGKISGSPLAAGVFDLLITVQNSFGGGSRPLRITVTDPAPLSSYAQVLKDNYGLSGAAAARNADPDGDGWTNLQEYAFGLNPTAAGGNLTKLSTTNGGIGITWLQRSDVTYLVRTSADLTTWDATLTALPSNPQPAGLPAGCTQYEAWLPAAGGKRFLRVEAEVP